MTSTVAASLGLLPVELLFRIFKDLDTETILFSIRYVCKRFHTITPHYHRYELNCQAIGKRRFHSICVTTAPNNVTALVLSNDDQTPGQIELFLSLSPIEEYSRLETVSLFHIEETYLKLVLDHLRTISTLASLTITSDPSSDLTQPTLESLSSVMGQRTLRHFDLTLTQYGINELEWPKECFIEHLRVFHPLSFVFYWTILQRSPHLKTMILKDWFVYDLEQASVDMVSSSLTSLSVMDCETEMNAIELMLSCAPSLLYLKIMSKQVDLCNGGQWEHFIRTKLPDLKRFELATQRQVGSLINPADVASCIAPFQTPFWLQEKQWFITALGIPRSGWINCFTLPDCAHKVHLYPCNDKVALSTAPLPMSHLFSTDQIREITVELRNVDSDATDQVGIDAKKTRTLIPLLSHRHDDSASLPTKTLLH